MMCVKVEARFPARRREERGCGPVTGKDRASCQSRFDARYWMLGWQEYTDELYKKDLHNPDNHDGVITDLEPDILECEVKWALESITTNKASGGEKMLTSRAVSRNRGWGARSGERGHSGWPLCPFV